MCHGGAERVAVNLANGFVGQKHEVFLYTDLTKEKRYVPSSEVQVRDFKYHNSNKLVKWVGIIRYLHLQVIREKPDVVIGIMSICSIVARLAVVGTSIPVIFSNHHALTSVEWKISLADRIFDRFLPPFFALTTVLTEIDKLVLKKYPGKVKVAPNPLTYQPLQTLPSKEPIILACGRIDAWKYKGFDLLLKAWAQLAAQYSGWTLYIAGGGSEESFAFLKAMCKDLGIAERVVFLGNVQNMQEWFQKADIFVLSSRSEGLPMTLLEAMSQGCASVALDNEGRTRDIIPNENYGILYPTGNVSKMAKGIEILLKDKDRKHTIQENSMVRAQTYNVDSVVTLWDSFFDMIK